MRGVDIPEIDTVLFLRPTESLTIFLQQLGRGLRLVNDKECLTVLDFVGNAHAEYDFSRKFRALVGKSHISIIDEVEEGFPHLPLGCSIVLQKQAKEIILQNIKNAIVNQRKIISWIRSYPLHTSHNLTITNFLRLFPQVSIEDIYKNKIDGGGGMVTPLRQGRIYRGYSSIKSSNGAIFRGISNRLLQCTSQSYLSFVRKLIINGSWDTTNPIENQMALMAHYDFWQKPGSELGFSSLQESLGALLQDSPLKIECFDVINHLLERLKTDEKPMIIGFPAALHLHSRYTRDEILSAFGIHRFGKKSSSREGAVEIKTLNCELLFVTLKKNGKKFFTHHALTTTMQSVKIFFTVQSHNAARPDKGRGLSYVQHRIRGKKIILFVREQILDEYGRAMGFINLGPVNLGILSWQPADEHNLASGRTSSAISLE